MRTPPSHRAPRPPLSETHDHWDTSHQRSPPARSAPRTPSNLVRRGRRAARSRPLILKPRPRAPRKASRPRRRPRGRCLLPQILLERTPPLVWGAAPRRDRAGSPLRICPRRSLVTINPRGRWSNRKPRAPLILNPPSLGPNHLQSNPNQIKRATARSPTGRPRARGPSPRRRTRAHRTGPRPLRRTAHLVLYPHGRTCRSSCRLDPARSSAHR